MNNHSNLNFKKAQLKKAFSLIELSVVVLIIGILIAGITQSSRLVRAMKLNTARSLTRSSDVASIRNLTAWFDATAEGVLSNTGDATTLSTNYIAPSHRDVVKLWTESNPQERETDKIILEYTGSNTASGSAPMYHNSGISGLPSIYFDGTTNTRFTMPTSGSSSRIISILGSPIPPGSNGASLFIVKRMDNFSSGDGNSNSIFSFQVQDTSNVTLGLATAAMGRPQYCDGSRYRSFITINPAFCSSADAFLNDSLPATDFKINTDYAVGGIVDFTKTGVNKARFYQNSTTSTATVLPTGAANTLTTLTTPNAFIIGGGNYNTAGTGQANFRGFISEVLIFDRALNNEEASSVMAYLIKKYNIKAL